jgi:hypothetical protein
MLGLLGMTSWGRLLLVLGVRLGVMGRRWIRNRWNCFIAVFIGRISSLLIVSFRSLVLFYMGWGVDADACIPTDTGENPKWNSTEPYYDSMYCNVSPHSSIPPSILSSSSNYRTTELTPSTVGHLPHALPTLLPPFTYSILRNRSSDDRYPTT